MSDARFNVNDPRFTRQSKRQRKVVIDDRFKSMFKPGAFTNKAPAVDKYGRRNKDSASGKSDLERFYRLEGGEQAEGGVADAAEARLAKLNRMARGDASDSSSSESSDSESDDASDSDDGAAAFGPGVCPPQFESRAVAEDEEEATNGRRIACVNLDWDRVKATDLFVLFQSFVPNVGALLSVSIYPSEFGAKKMAEEEKFGPSAVWSKSSTDGSSSSASAAAANAEEEEEEESSDASSDDSSDDEEKDGFNMQKLREYELQKLKYFFAVVECDSARTALALYQNCDGMEFEHSANTLNLSFVDDGFSFPAHTTAALRDQCSEAPATYSASSFTSRALQHTEVKLTWDGTDPEREQQLQWKPAERLINDDDFAAYLASDGSSSSEEEDEVDAEGAGGAGTKTAKKKQRAKFAGLLAAIGCNVDDIDDDEASDESSDADGVSDSDWASGGDAKAKAVAKAMAEELSDEEEFGEHDDWAREMRASGMGMDDGDDEDEAEEEGQELTCVSCIAVPPPSARARSRPHTTLALFARAHAHARTPPARTPPARTPSAHTPLTPVSLYLPLHFTRIMLTI